MNYYYEMTCILYGPDVMSLPAAEENQPECAQVEIRHFLHTVLVTSCSF